MAEAKQESFSLTITGNVLNVLNAAQGFTLSGEQLRALALGELSAPPVRRCVGAIGYDSEGTILLVTFIDGSTIDRAGIENLSQFRSQLEGAANYGHSVAIVINSTTKRIEFFQAVPCECPCKDRDGPVLSPRTLGRNKPPQGVQE